MRPRSALFAFDCGLLLTLFCAFPARSQGASAPAADTCRADIVDADNYKIRFVRFSGRYSDLTPPAPGTPYTTQKASDLVGILHDALRKESLRENVAGATQFQLLNSVSPEKGVDVEVSFVTPCVRVVNEPDCVRSLDASSPKCVDIVVEAFSLRINSGDIWGNLLHNTRSNAPTFFSKVPASVLTLNPKFGTDYDRRYGASGFFGVSSNLFDLSRNLKNKPLHVKASRLDVSAQGHKSFENNFYDANTKIAYSRQLSKTIDAFSLHASFSAEHKPLGPNNYLQNAGTGGGSLKFRTNVASFSVITLGGDYVGSSNRLSQASGASSVDSRENTFAGRLLSDGQWAGGFSRLGVWVDHGVPTALPGSYHRLVTMVGYAREFLIAPNQTIALEALAGGGGAWGTLPPYDRFFGGNLTKNFLYESSDSPVLSTLPTGPLLRSLGSSQGTSGTAALQQGGTSYWHFNVNLAFPIRKWSRPLIPSDISIDGIPKTDANCKKVLDSDGNLAIEDRPLGEILKSQGACAKNSLAQMYRQQGLSRADAEAKAIKDLTGVDSVLSFLVDRANLISVKPLLMFDAARLYNTGNPDDHTRYGVGGGFQVTVVIAKFEAGYLVGVRRFPTDPPGNFVVRLVFQNLF
jgi:hypothetical protein